MQELGLYTFNYHTVQPNATELEIYSCKSCITGHILGFKQIYASLETLFARQQFEAYAVSVKF